jgi:SAM-dependent methyltransferase
MMCDYWEKRFKNEGAMWNYYPADSAIKTIELFKKENINEILIPGFGYGRNAKVFIDNGFKVTGIELAGSAIELARLIDIECVVHNASVTSMPFDDIQYEGIFCYALIHLLNKSERYAFLRSCYNQLKSGGLMIFTVTTKESGLYGMGKILSKDRFEIAKGLKVFFYDTVSVTKEFSNFGLISSEDIDEPVRFMEGEQPVKLKLVICRKKG